LKILVEKILYRTYFTLYFPAHYYKMAGPEELKHFLADPEKYVPPLAPRKLPEPELLPKRHIPKDVKASQTIELKGYCPVTFLDGKCRYVYVYKLGWLFGISSHLSSVGIAV
jgi:adenylate/nucleoside-diphosphate kinase